MELTDFAPLKPAEETLVAWLKAGNRGTCVISDAVPPAVPDSAHVIRATLIRWLALGGGEGCKPPETGVQVQGAYVEGDDACGAETQGIDLEGAAIAGDLALFNCRIPDQIMLRSASIRSMFLNKSVLMAGLCADYVEVKGTVFLSDTYVKGRIRFFSAKISGNLELDRGVFGLDPSSETYRTEQTKAKRAENSDEGDFVVINGSRMNIGGSLTLRGAEIRGELRLKGAWIGGSLSLRGATLTAHEADDKKRALSCNRAHIEGALILRNAPELSKSAIINGRTDLRAATLGSINDKVECWSGPVRLLGCRYGALIDAPTDANSRKRWLAMQNKEKIEVDFSPDPYEQCAKVLREAGHVADAQEILIEKEKLQRAARRKRLARELDEARKTRDAALPASGFRPHSDRVIGLWWHFWALRVWDAILGAVVGYGRKPQNAALWALLFIGIGWVFFLRAEGFGQIKPNLPQVQRAPEWVECREGGERRLGFESQVACFHAQPEGHAYPRFNALVYSIDTFTPVVSLEMQSYWIPDDTKPIGRFARWYLWLHIAMGWALTLLAVAGFSGLIKQDSK